MRISAHLLDGQSRASCDTMPVIGFLSTRDASDSATLIAAYREGLKDSGYVEGQDVAAEYRWGGGLYDRMPELASELVQRH
jgi:putative ABC transport system substrate-binding protein